MDRGAWWATVHGWQRVRHDWANKHSSTELEKHLTLLCFLILFLFFRIRCHSLLNISFVERTSVGMIDHCSYKYLQLLWMLWTLTQLPHFAPRLIANSENRVSATNFSHVGLSQVDTWTEIHVDPTNSWWVLVSFWDFCKLWMNIFVCGAQWPNCSVIWKRLCSVWPEVSFRDDRGGPSWDRLTGYIVLTLESAIPGASQVVLVVRIPLPMQEIQKMRVWCLNQEDPLKKGMATRSWRIPWSEEPGGYSPWGHKRVGHNWATEHACTTQPWLTALCPALSISQQ